MQKVECVVVGDSGVGKTAFVKSHLEKTFPVEYVPTSFDEYYLERWDSQNEIKVSLVIRDTPGNGHDDLRPSYYRQTSVFVIAFSVVDPLTIGSMELKWIPEIRLHCPKVPFVAVGTKVDERTGSSVEELYSKKKLRKLVAKLGGVKYLECSAKSGDGLEKLFQEVLNAALNFSCSNDRAKPLMKAFPFGVKRKGKESFNLRRLSLCKNDCCSIDFKTFTSCLGNGSFGTVFHSVDLNSAIKHSAVKIVFLDPTDEEMNKCLVRECSTMETLLHKNLVQIYEAVEKDVSRSGLQSLCETRFRHSQESLDRLDLLSIRVKKKVGLTAVCLRMELCGPTLRHWINNAPSTNGRNCGIQLAIIFNCFDGLEYMHSRKILHRDLKPENILFTYSDGTDMDFRLPVKIGDFGLSRTLHSHGSKTSSLTSNRGTENYRAPETQFDEYGLQADLFSLGLIIWETFQYIPPNYRRDWFQRLVYGGETELVEDHTIVETVKPTILMLTKRDTSERLASVHNARMMLSRLPFILSNHLSL